jgi:hypothetical protein
MSVPDTMFTDREQVRISAFNNWVLDHGVTEIVMAERQFWKFVTVQPLAEKPWTTFMGQADQRSGHAGKQSEATGIVRQAGIGTDLTSGMRQIA